MKGATKTVGLEKKNYCKPAAKYTLSLLSCLVVLFLAFGEVRAQAEWPHVVPSKDGTPISYEIYGVGEPSLVFVHGWSCDARYWRAQLPHFSKNASWGHPKIITLSQNEQKRNVDKWIETSNIPDKPIRTWHYERRSDG